MAWIQHCHHNCATNRWNLLSLPPANEVWGKVIFLHLFVILFMVICLSASWDTTPPGPGTPRCRACWEIRSTRRRYASYWNAILFKWNLLTFILILLMVLYLHCMGAGLVQEPNGKHSSLWFKKKTLVAQLGYQAANPGSPDHISGSPENSLQYVLEICRQNVLFEALHWQKYTNKEVHSKVY